MALYLILMGAQGAGKGTQAALIRDHYQLLHLSTGDAFRAMKTRTDDLARHVQELMAAGKLIDDDTTNAVVADRLAQPDAAKGAILDGYPRNPIQAAFLNQYLSERGHKVNAVLLLHVDLYTAFKRAFGRVTASDGEGYNIFFRNQGISISTEKHPEGLFPPRIIAQKEGEMLSRRADDADALAVIKRIDTYVAETQPLIDFYQQAGILHTLDADRPIDSVSADLMALIEQVKG